MNAILEINPSITDTEQDQDALIRELQELAKTEREEDDFVAECPDGTSELFEESSTIFTIDGKNKEFTYISSYKNGSDLISFGQDALGLWWYFIRTSITSGKKLNGPYRTKEKLLAAMEKLNA